MVNNRPARGGQPNGIKRAIWIIWLAAIAAAAASAGGYRQVNFLFQTETGISIAEPMQFITYYLVVGLFFGFSLAFRRRAFCHYGCWMAPFMILGRKVSNLLRLPAQHLHSDAARCADCMTCVTHCPMRLDVNRMVRSGSMENAECVLCRTCVDSCPNGAIKAAFYWA